MTLTLYLVSHEGRSEEAKGKGLMVPQSAKEKKIPQRRRVCSGDIMT